MLKTKHSRSILIAEVTLGNFASQRRWYAKYLLNATRGSICRVGLSSAELNRSSLLCFLNDGVQGENKFCVDPRILIQDFISRLNERIKRYDRLLSTATNNWVLSITN